MSHTVTVVIGDLTLGATQDVSAIALQKGVKVRWNHARQAQVTFPAGHSLLTDTFGTDGLRVLQKGDRQLLIFEDDVLVFRGRIFTVERTGDGRKNRAVVTAFDPWMELGFEGDDRAGRPVRGASTIGGGYDGNFISPKFNDDGPISGGDLVQQILTNSQNTGAESDPTPGEGPVPIDLTLGTFDTSIGPAIDLSPAGKMDWPILIGDFFQMLVATNVVDINMWPTVSAPDPYSMVYIDAVNSGGTDRSGTVHFDYWTGSKNAATARHVDDWSTINNKFYLYLGPRGPFPGIPFSSTNQWKGLITPGVSGTTVDPSASRTRYGGPDGGQMMSIAIDDTLGTPPPLPPLALAYWNAMQGLRVEPRQMLFMRPKPGDKSLFAPFGIDFDVGDLIAVNTGGGFGLDLALAQRVYGYDVEWSRAGVRRMSELFTSADAA